ncbi:MAG: hypothetical protein GX847_09430 [Clostridiales bacterium]|nr:hypothetical protein [Clostridiales bacterium]
MTLSHSAKICLGAVFTSTVFMLQASSVFLPVLGPLLGAACIVFVAVSAVLLKSRAVLVYLGAGFLTLTVSPRYAFEFLLTTGFAGLTLGLLQSRKPALALLVSFSGMLAGLWGLSSLLGTAAFGGLLAGLPICACLPVFTVFAAVYPAAGLVVLKRAMKMRIIPACYCY